MLHLGQFTLLCAVALLSGSLVSCAIRQILAERVAAGFIQHNYLLWSSKVPSTLACLRLCSADDSCIGFNFIQHAQTGVCRGHSNVSEQTSSARNFTVDAYMVVSRYHPSSSEDSSEEITDENEDERAVELLDDCETADNCSQTSTSVQSWGCYQSYCQCALGFFYQVSTGSCLNSCPITQALPDEFLRYENYQVILLDGFTVFIGVWPEEECDAQCLATTGCQALNFVQSTMLCTGYGYLVDYGTLDMAHFSQENGTVFKMRQCP